MIALSAQACTTMTTHAMEVTNKHNMCICIFTSFLAVTVTISLDIWFDQLFFIYVWNFVDASHIDLNLISTLGHGAKNRGKINCQLKN